MKAFVSVITLPFLEMSLADVKHLADLIRISGNDFDIKVAERTVESLERRIETIKSFEIETREL